MQRPISHTFRFAATVIALCAFASPHLSAQELPKPVRLPAWAVQAAAEKALNDVHACYVRYVPAEERVGNGDNARVSLRFTPSGAIDSVTWADTTVTQASARSCILDAVRKIRAPIATARPTTVEVWFGLSSKRADTTVRVEDDPAQRITSKSVVQAATAKMSSFIACYEDRLDDRPNLAGRVKIRVTVGAAGKVTSVDVLESLDPKVDACVVGHARSLTFAPPGDDAPVIATIPITFGSK